MIQDIIVERDDLPLGTDEQRLCFRAYFDGAPHLGAIGATRLRAIGNFLLIYGAENISDLNLIMRYN